MSTSRRDFIVGSLGIGAGALLASCGSNGLLSATPAVADEVTYPWPYQPLDAKAAAQRGYDIYWERHCMAGPFQAVVAELGKTLGEPYSTFPFEMLEVGSGGLQVSTVCGTCNGAAMALGLFVGNAEDRSAMVTELFNWYEQTELPIFIPPNPHEDMEVVKTAARSNLCHASCSRWAAASGLSPYSSAKKERCARLTADATEKLVEILNSYFAGSFAATTPLTDTTKSCRGCHDKGGMLENTRAKMDCMSCHEDHTS